MICRSGCGACCAAASISSAIPGKPAGVRCVQLDCQPLCLIFGQRARPTVCASLAPSPVMCGASDTQAMIYLTRLEKETAPT